VRAHTWTCGTPREARIPAGLGAVHINTINPRLTLCAPVPPPMGASEGAEGRCGWAAAFLWVSAECRALLARSERRAWPAAPRARRARVQRRKTELRGGGRALGGLRALSR